MSELPKHILVAEDSLTQAFALRGLLQNAGFSVTVVEHGRAVLQELEKQKVDLVVSDVDMPEMNGYDMCEAIRQMDGFKNLPVILLTTLSAPEHILFALNSQASYFLTKPFKPSYLLEKVAALLNTKNNLNCTETEPPIDFEIKGKNYATRATRAQMLNVLLCTYENAIQQNHELMLTQMELNKRNQTLREQSTKLEQQRELLQKANAELEMLARRDGLTGLRNFRAFKEVLDQLISSHLSSSDPLSLILLDVDKFKDFNDSFGHPAGDEVLRSVARILQGSIPLDAFAARYGGEEFVIVLPETSLSDARDCADAVRRAIESASWKLRPVTASFGVATLGSSLNTAQALINAADEALYASKRTGRNKVTVAPLQTISP